MTEKSFTLFEIHLHDGIDFEATNTAPAIGERGDGASDSETDSDATGEPAETPDSGPCSTSGGRVLGAVVAVVLLVALAAAAKYLRGDGDETELDDFVEE
ncbi:hypothetical protein DVK02_06325 [Halobellus sp. Atlit-31R]|nr:hypothetical protein DVK02_06325 [Halobellus sp. Atlit-31R]